MTKRIPKFRRKVMRDPNLEKQKLRHWHWQIAREIALAPKTRTSRLQVIIPIIFLAMRIR